MISSLPTDTLADIIAPTRAETPRLVPLGRLQVLEDEGPANTGYISEDSSDSGVVFKDKLTLLISPRQAGASPPPRAISPTSSCRCPSVVTLDLDESRVLKVRRLLSVVLTGEARLLCGAMAATTASLT